MRISSWKLLSLQFFEAWKQWRVMAEIIPIDRPFPTKKQVEPQEPLINLWSIVGLLSHKNIQEPFHFLQKNTKSQKRVSRLTSDRLAFRLMNRSIFSFLWHLHQLHLHQGCGMINNRPHHIDPLNPQCWAVSGQRHIGDEVKEEECPCCPHIGQWWHP